MSRLPAALLAAAVLTTAVAAGGPALAHDNHKHDDAPAQQPRRCVLAPQQARWQRCLRVSSIARPDGATTRTDQPSAPARNGSPARTSSAGSVPTAVTTM